MPRPFKAATAVLLIIALLAPAAAASYSASANTTDNLRLRSQPSLSAAILVTAPKGSAVTVTQKDPIVNSDGSWYPVVYNNREGFMSSLYLDIKHPAVPPATPAVAAAQSSAFFIAAGKTTDSLRLRKEPSLRGDILTTAPKGSAVAVTQKDPIVNSDGSWYPVVYNNREGFMSAPYLSLAKDGDTLSETGYIKESSVNFRSGPDTASSRLASLPKFTKISVTGTSGGWYAVRHDGKDGFIRADLVILGNPGYSPGTAAASSSASTAAPSNEKTQALKTLDSAGVCDKRRELVEYSFNYLGKPYKYAGAGPNSFDCSGFTSYIFKQFGYKINRSSIDQYRFTGTGAAKADLLPGDLVFFKTSNQNIVTHVGIYIGGGDFIHSSSGKAYCVTISTLNSGYYFDRYVGAKRVL
jgi:cell wall-associated NlpC family hydrolase